MIVKQRNIAISGCEFPSLAIAIWFCEVRAEITLFLRNLGEGVRPPPRGFPWKPPFARSYSLKVCFSSGVCFGLLWFKACSNPAAPGTVNMCLDFQKKLHLNICNRYIYLGASRWSPFGVIKSDVFYLFWEIIRQVCSDSSFQFLQIASCWLHTLSLHLYISIYIISLSLSLSQSQTAELEYHGTVPIP